MSSRIEERSGVKVIILEQGCRPASSVEVQMLEELTDLRARCEKAEKDAERYRKTRKDAFNITMEGRIAPCESWVEIEPGWNDDYDNHIDAAIAKERA